MNQESITRPTDPRNTPFRCFRTTDNVTLRTGHWVCSTRVCRGTVVILSGRTEFMEKYLETIQELRGRGFDVISFDWRGQGLSDRLLKENYKGYIGSYNHYLGDLTQVMEKIVIPQVRGDLIVLAHSMGGHLALRYLSEPSHVKISKAVLCAPMLGIQTFPLPADLARYWSRLMVHLGLGHVDVPGSRQNPYRTPFKYNRLTSDPVRFNRMMAAIHKAPVLGVGSVTFGWLAATFESFDMLGALQSAQSIALPILIAMAGCDQIVRNDTIEKFVCRVPNHRIVVIDQAKHELLQERDLLRNQFWKAFDDFVAE